MYKQTNDLDQNWARGYSSKQIISETKIKIKQYLRNKNLQKLIII